MSDQIINLSIGASWGRRVLLLIVPAALALGGVWFAARWCLANTIAEWVPDGAAARAAARIAPDDPQTHFTLAELGARTLEPAELPEAVRQYELAASLSPNDYRLWMKLGQARGQLGDVAGAEDALRRAVALAPKYPDPHWFLGNQLLRQGRSDEAFAELQQAGDANPTRFRPQVFDLAWHVYRADVPSVLNAVGTSAGARAQLAEYLLNQKRADDALRLWSGLTAAQKREQSAIGDKLLHALYDAKRYRDAFELQRDLAAATATTTSATPAVGALLNGGFEAAVGVPNRGFFDWQVTPLAGVQIGLDERVRHSGARSLRLVFNAPNSFDFNNVSQFIVIEPRTRYRLTYFVRVDDLKSASTLTTQIIDPASGRGLAASAPLPTGTADWQMIALDFTPDARTEAITVRLSRPPCSAATCPMFGKVWYDDFTLQPLGGVAGSVDRNAGSSGDGRAPERTR